MSDQRPKVGTVGRFDLTVEDAESVRDFYAAVVGWRFTAQDVGGYEDFDMRPPGSTTPVAGICHARGANAGLPPQWLPYINVEDAAASADSCVARGGEVVVGPRDLGSHGTMYVIRDPAGAAVALLSPPEA